MLCRPLVKKGFFYFVFFLTVESQLFAQGTDVGRSVPLTIPASYENRLIQEAEFMDALVDENGDYWILTKKSLIRWSIESTSMDFFPFPSDQGLQNPRFLVASANFENLLVAANSWLAIVESNPLRMSKVSLTQKFSANKKLLSVTSPREGGFLFVHQSGVFKLDQKFRLLEMKSSDPLLEVANMGCINTDGSEYFFVVDGSLSVKQSTFSLQKKINSPVVTERVIGLSCHDGDLTFLRTMSELIVLKSNKIVQRIKISAERRLLAKHIDSQVHGFLFDNGLVEIYYVKDKAKRSFQVALPKGQVHKFIVNAQRMLILTQNKPYAFQLSQG